MGRRKTAAEFVDVDRLVVRMNIFKTKILPRKKFHNIILFIQQDHCPVHPAFKRSHKSQIGIRVADDLGQHLLFKN